MRGRRRTLILMTSLLVVLGILLSAQAQTQTLVDKVKELKLKNGMRFLVVERHEAPVVFGSVVYNVGSANEWPNVTGISHLLEHMMFKGTKLIGTTNYKKEIPYIKKTDEIGDETIALRREMGEWRFKIFEDFSKNIIAQFTDEENERVASNKYEQNKLIVEKIRAMKSLPDSISSVPYLLEDQGVNYLDKYLKYKMDWGELARLLDEERKYIVNNEIWETYTNNGAKMLNAFTSNDFTFYFAYLPANRLELWMDIESDRMNAPVFREFWSERDVVMEERRLGENDPDEVLSESFFSAAFSASPYKWPVVGWMSVLQTIDRKELAAYHKKFYAPNNAVAIIVGDVDFATVAKMAKRYFGAISAQTPPEPIKTREPEQSGERRLVVEHTANPKLMIGFHKPVFPHPDAAKFAVLEEVLAGGRSSRLYKSIFEEKELTAREPRVYDGPGQRYDNLMVIEAEPRDPHTLEEVENAIYEELDKLKTEPITDRELQRVKNQIDAMQIRQLGSNMGIVFQLAMGELFFGNYKNIFTYYDRVKQVTKQDIMDIAKKYLVEKNRTVAYRVKKEEAKEAQGGEEGLNSEDIDQQALMDYMMSLPQDEQMRIRQKLMSLKSKSEAQKYMMELIKKAEAEGYHIMKKKSEESKEAK